MWARAGGSRVVASACSGSHTSLLVIATGAPSSGRAPARTASSAASATCSPASRSCANGSGTSHDTRGLEGQRIHFLPDFERIHFFDPESGAEVSGPKIPRNKLPFPLTPGHAPRGKISPR